MASPGRCADRGLPRNTRQLRKTVTGGPDPLTDVDGFLTAMDGYAELGIDQVWVGPSGPDPAGWVSQITEKVLPRLRDIDEKD
jgi:hypothetical protein